jgi:hypothetical protein
MPWHVFYVDINPTMSNKNLANGKYQMKALLFKYNHQDNNNDTQEFETW